MFGRIQRRDEGGEVERELHTTEGADDVGVSTFESVEQGSLTRLQLEARERNRQAIERREKIRELVADTAFALLDVRESVHRADVFHKIEGSPEASEMRLSQSDILNALVHLDEKGTIAIEPVFGRLSRTKQS